ncbi:MAG: hypothetical protein HC884_06090 [Chloroflexaceae bacterium]|nr:hypothetical protein [Chloroflexaceae bacterium]
MIDNDTRLMLDTSTRFAFCRLSTHLVFRPRRVVSGDLPQPLAAGSLPFSLFSGPGGIIVEKTNMIPPERDTAPFSYRR